MDIPYTVAARPDTGLNNGKIAIWLFLASEVMLFGALFASYVMLRVGAPEWPAGATYLNVPLATLNTVVLISSSVTMVLAWASLVKRNFSRFRLFLGITILCGLVFLVIKYFEYASKFEHHLVPGAHFSYVQHHVVNGVATEMTLPYGSQLFFSLYFIMTGIHAAHMVVGIGLMLVILAMSWKGKFGPKYYGPIEVSGLYWHFVDIVWIFLFPLLYLLGRHG